MLRQKTRDWFKERDLRNKTKLERHERRKCNEARTTAQFALRDLTFLAENLPIEYVDQIFNDKNMRPLFDALFRFPIATIEPKRIVDLIKVFVDNVNSTLLAKKLTPQLYNLLMNSTSDRTLLPLKAIYFSTYYKVVEKSRKTKG